MGSQNLEVHWGTPKVVQRQMTRAKNLYVACDEIPECQNLYVPVAKRLYAQNLRLHQALEPTRHRLNSTKPPDRALNMRMEPKPADGNYTQLLKPIFLKTSRNGPQNLCTV